MGHIIIQDGMRSRKHLGEASSALFPCLPPISVKTSSSAGFGGGGKEGASDASGPPGCAEWEGHPLLQFPRLGMNGGGSGPTPIAVPAPLTKSPSFSVTAFLSAR